MALGDAHTGSGTPKVRSWASVSPVSRDGGRAGGADLEGSATQTWDSLGPPQLLWSCLFPLDLSIAIYFHGGQMLREFFFSRA